MSKVTWRQYCKDIDTVVSVYIHEKDAPLFKHLGIKANSKKMAEAIVKVLYPDADILTVLDPVKIQPTLF